MRRRFVLCVVERTLVPLWSKSCSAMLVLQVAFHCCRSWHFHYTHVNCWLLQFSVCYFIFIFIFHSGSFRRALHGLLLELMLNWKVDDELIFNCFKPYREIFFLIISVFSYLIPWKLKWGLCSISDFKVKFESLVKNKCCEMIFAFSMIVIIENAEQHIVSMWGPQHLKWTSCSM